MPMKSCTFKDYSFFFFFFFNIRWYHFLFEPNRYSFGALIVPVSTSVPDLILDVSSVAVHSSAALLTFVYVC